MCVRAVGAAVNPSQATGVIASGLATTTVGVAGFATVHAMLIAPVWTEALLRAPLVLIAGLAMAWAYEIRIHAPGVQSLSTGVRFGAGLFLTLIPATVLENALRLRGTRLPESLEIPTVLAIAALSGAVAGGLLRERRVTRGVIASAAASAALTTVMSGPIPVVNSRRAALLFVSFLPLCVAAGAGLAAVRRKFL